MEVLRSFFTLDLLIRSFYFNHYWLIKALYICILFFLNNISNFNKFIFWNYAKEIPIYTKLSLKTFICLFLLLLILKSLYFENTINIFDEIIKCFININS